MAKIAKRGFWFAIVSLFIFSVILRFWGLSRFNTLVFDEVHFAKFANNYLIQRPFFENHPPLGKYFIALGIWLSQFTPFGQGESNTLAGSPLTPFSYRWMNALVGSFVPLVVAGIAYQLSKWRSYALMAGLFAALDGLLLVESRYALINIYLIVFGLLGQWLFLIALERSRQQRSLYLILAGICFGASFSVKWNGLAFLLGVYLLWGVAKLIEFVQSRWTKPSPASADRDPPAEADALPPRTTTLQRLAHLDAIDLLVELGIIPLIVYCLIWIPHLQLNTNMDFWQWQKYLYYSQKSVGNGPNVHPYCSAWYTWILMLRPVAYYFDAVRQFPKNIPDLSPLLPAPEPTETYYGVHAIGNPALWWLSTFAIALFLGLLIQKIALLSSPRVPHEKKVALLQSPSLWIFLYLLVNYIANLLPWMTVTRCTFLYHYMGSSIFSLLAIAYCVDSCLRDRRIALQLMGAASLCLIVASFLFWLPIYLGLPLSPAEFQSRMWFRSWY